MKYNCPICQQNLTLQAQDKQLACANNHQFDRAKQGYFNLLPVQRKKSKQPGDSKEMIAARQDFLNSDYYLPLAEKLTQLITDELPPAATLLDLGCGEGYYARQILSELEELTLYGIDISKAAIIKAAAQDKRGHYSVASSDLLPLQDNSTDAILKVYAPANDQEMARVLTDDGLLITVTPGPRHLWQLREFIYDDVRPHDTQNTQFDGFKLRTSEQFNFRITPSTKHRDALLQMTPFAWKANQQQTLTIHQAQDLEIELDFVINLYQVD